MRIRWLRTGRAGGAFGLIAVALGAVLLASCEPQEALDSSDDYNVVLTLYDGATDYGTISTYLMPDSVVHFQDAESKGLALTHDYDDLILERVEYNLQAVGYRRESDPENQDPDIIVMVSITSSDWRAGNYSWLPRWGWYDLWAGGSEDWYFSSPYYTRGRDYTFSAGTLIIDIGDIRDAEWEEAGEEEVEMKGIWTAAMNAVLKQETSGTPQELVNVIDRAFDQSPYLGVGE